MSDNKLSDSKEQRQETRTYIRYANGCTHEQEDQIVRTLITHQRHILPDRLVQQYVVLL